MTTGKAARTVRVECSPSGLLPAPKVVSGHCNTSQSVRCGPAYSPDGGKLPGGRDDACCIQQVTRQAGSTERLRHAPYPDAGYGVHWMAQRKRVIQP